MVRERRYSIPIEQHTPGHLSIIFVLVFLRYLAGRLGYKQARL